MQPLEVLRVGIKREFVVVDPEDEYGQTVLSLAAQEVGRGIQAHRVLCTPASGLAGLGVLGSDQAASRGGPYSLCEG